MNVTVNITKQFGGDNFALSPIEQIELEKKFPEISIIPHIYISNDRKTDFQVYYAPIKHQILSILLGKAPEFFESKGIHFDFFDLKTRKKIAI